MEIETLWETQTIRLGDLKQKDCFCFNDFDIESICMVTNHPDEYNIQRFAVPFVNLTDAIIYHGDPEEQVIRVVVKAKAYHQERIDN